MSARFHLQRVEDESGVSGTGRVAEGVMFSDGACAMRWLTAHRSTAVYASISDLIHIHGHGGKTQIVFDDCPGCEHDWRHHWMDNCGGCDVHPCQCTAMASLPIGAVAPPDKPRDADCLCSPRVNAELLSALKAVADFDPDDSGGEGWRREDGWCWCGGLKRHDAVCRQARLAVKHAEAA
jgi:hypothetical protein